MHSFVVTDEDQMLERQPSSLRNVSGKKWRAYQGHRCFIEAKMALSDIYDPKDSGRRQVYNK
jgi:hypothetical protein